MHQGLEYSKNAGNGRNSDVGVEPENQASQGSRVHREPDGMDLERPDTDEGFITFWWQEDAIFAADEARKNGGGFMVRYFNTIGQRLGAFIKIKKIPMNHECFPGTIYPDGVAQLVAVEEGADGNKAYRVIDESPVHTVLNNYREE